MMDEPCLCKMATLMPLQVVPPPMRSYCPSPPHIRLQSIGQHPLDDRLRLVRLPRSAECIDERSAGHHVGRDAGGHHLLKQGYGLLPVAAGGARMDDGSIGMACRSRGRDGKDQKNTG